MTNKQIEKMARRIHKDYSRTPFELLSVQLKALFIFFSAWHIDNMPKKKVVKNVYHDDFCNTYKKQCQSEGAGCDNCGSCKNVFDATIKFIKEQE